MTDKAWQLSWDDVYPARKGRGGDIKVVCPACDQRKGGTKEKDLSVNQKSGLYNCKSLKCGIKGIIVEEKGSMDPSRMHRKDAEATSPSDYRAPDTSRLSPLSQPIIDYMAGRGISKETLEAAGVRTYTDFDGTPWVLLAYASRDGRRLVNFKRRTTNPKADKSKRFRSSEGTYKPVYLMNLLDESPDVIYICEAEIDALSMLESGFRNVVSMASGAGPGKKLDCLVSIRAELNRAKKVVIITDNDQAGMDASEEIARWVGVGKSAIASFPGHMSSCNDLNDVLMEFGKDGVRELASGASGVTVDGFSDSDDIRELLWSHRNDPDEEGYRTTQFPEFSKKFRIVPQTLTVVTGTPMAGKSSFMRALLWNTIGSNENFNVAAFASEDAKKVYKFYRKMVRMVTGKPMNALDRAEYEMAMDIMSGRWKLIHPESSSLEEIIMRAELAVDNYGVKCVLIDNWTEVETRREYGEGETEHINRCIRQLTKLAVEKDVAVIVVAHPTKEAGEAANASGKELSLYSVSGTASWNNKPDLGLIVSRDRSTPGSPTVVKVDKVRDPAYGEMAKVEFDHDPATGRFREIGLT